MLVATAAYPINTPELKAIPNTNYGTLKNLLVFGYINTTGVTIKPYLIHSHGSENNIPKFKAIKPPKNMPA